ncbi:MAG: nucleoside-diphosphate-sugar epimerase [Flammeovirgaceae bacterium]|jgi:dihydroflavonol-4-reductase
MKYLITGANGLVGSHLARHILANGGEVRATKRANSNLDFVGDIAQQIDWVEADILDVLGLENAMKDIDFVIHAAAVVSFSPKKKVFMQKVNVEGTANVVNACLENGIKKLAHISSVGAIGRPMKKTNLDETQKWENSELNSYYSNTKYQAEQEVFRGIAEGLDAIIVNPSIVLGRGDLEQSSSQLFKYVWESKKYYPKGTLNYVDVRDVALATFDLLHSEISAERFILNGGNIPYPGFFEMVAQKLDKVVEPKLVEPWMGAIAWRWEKAKSIFTGKEPLLTRETVASSASNITFNGNKVTKVANFKYRNLKNTIDWVTNGLLEGES